MFRHLRQHHPDVGAEALLARLSKSCYFNCSEKKQLAAAIEAYKKAN